jgi:Cu2+-containing amine oxidase
MAPAACPAPAAAAAAATAAAPHPLDPLTPGEVAAAAAACRARAAGGGALPGRGGAPGRLRFNTVTLQEPPKAALLAFRAGRGPAPPRTAFCILQAPPAFGVVEALVALAPGGGAEVVSWTPVRARAGGPRRLQAGHIPLELHRPPPNPPAH